MAIRIIVHSVEGLPRGHIVFHSTLISHDSDFQCDPPGCLTRQEVEELARQLRHLPAAHSGTVMGYPWREE